VNAPDTVPDAVTLIRLTDSLCARYPDHGQLIAFLSRSYEYIRNLPLKGLRENYFRENPELFDMVL
jgi:hypothetical protein